jgi:pyroglutamyl-peptidase
MALTILVTGFGPFPGAPFNPTGPLVQRLARLRRPALADTKIVAHIFPTSYAAVDSDLPRLLAKHKPHALLMFGLAPRARALRIETRGRNTVSLLPDVTSTSPRGHTIAAGGPAAIALPAPTRYLLAAVRAAGVPATLSRDAGRYLCNYLCWRAADAAGKPGGPHVAVFVHVPKVRRGPVPRARVEKGRMTITDLARAGGAILPAIAVAAWR